MHVYIIEADHRLYCRNQIFLRLSKETIQSQADMTVEDQEETTLNTPKSAHTFWNVTQITAPPEPKPFRRSERTSIAPHRLKVFVDNKSDIYDPYA